MNPIIISAIVTAVLVIVAAILLGWAAESAEKFIAPGLALAILALLQTLPEYTVEAVIAWSGNTHLMVANLTGSLRLLLGFGWPMIFIIAGVAIWFKKKTFLRELTLSPHQALETIFLTPAVTFFTIIWLKRTMTPIDGLILIATFFVFIWAISKAHVDKEDSIESSDMPGIVRKIVRAPSMRRNTYIALLFVGGGAVIFAVAHPFVESLKSLAVSMGISEFLFIQWVAPFVSEFPEKTTAFMWAARSNKATTGMMNMVSSNLNQWLLLAGSLPIILSISKGSYSAIPFDDHQCQEIILTILQTAMVLACMLNAKINWWKVILILTLWIAGFFLPAERSHIIWIHLVLVILISAYYFIRQPVPELWKLARASLIKPTH